MQKIRFGSENKRLFKLAPTKIIVLSFIVIILIGTLLLSLPVSSNNGRSAGLFVSLFTASSATCVTGFVVVDTLTQWSVFGQIVILILIQIGGLGFITFATFFSVLLGRKVGLKGMLLAQESLNHFSFEGILKLVRRVVTTALSIELIGALLLSMSFVPKFGARGLYLGLFHSITAFCNAGFDIMGNHSSFIGYHKDPIVIYTIAGLVITGGLGFIVWKDLFEFARTRTLLLHTKVVLTISAFLIVFGAVFFFIFEAGNPATMGNLTLLEKINSSVFHSITTRSAGFNTIPINDMTETSKVGTMLLMFVGAAPGSTAGGVKVTTFSVIIIAILSQLKGSGDVIIFKRRVSNYTVNKSLAIIGLSAIWVITFTTVSLALEKDQTFLNMFFEITSAFATVGLSAASTPTLSMLTKVIIIVSIFIGRVGPISFAIALTLRANRTKTDIVYPEGKIVVG